MHRAVYTLRQGETLNPAPFLFLTLWVKCMARGPPWTRVPSCLQECSGDFDSGAGTDSVMSKLDPLVKQ